MTGITCGVPQGSTLGALLFSDFVVAYSSLFLLLSADDTSLYPNFLHECHLHTDNCDVADSLPGSGAVLHHHHVSAAVLALCLHQAERHGGQCVLEHDMLVGLQLFVISVPHDGWRRFASVASLQQAAFAHTNDDLITEVQLNGRWLC